MLEYTSDHGLLTLKLHIIDHLDPDIHAQAKLSIMESALYENYHLLLKDQYRKHLDNDYLEWKRLLEDWNRIRHGEVIGDTST